MLMFAHCSASKGKKIEEKRNYLETPTSNQSTRQKEEKEEEEIKNENNNKTFKKHIQCTCTHTLTSMNKRPLTV